MANTAGRMPVAQLVTEWSSIDEAVWAFKYACLPKPDTRKVMIGL